MYEMLVGYPPFYAEDPITTCKKVLFKLLIFFLLDSTVVVAQFQKTPAKFKILLELPDNFRSVYSLQCKKLFSVLIYTKKLPVKLQGYWEID